MKFRNLTAAVAILATAMGSSTAQTATETKKPATTKHAKTTAKKASAAQQQQEQTQQMLNDLKTSLDGLRQQVNDRDQKIQDLQQQLQSLKSDLNTTKSASESTAAAQQQKVETLTQSVDTLKASDVKTTALVQDTQTRVKAVENPTALKYKGVTITPGGFLEATALVRTHNENADVVSTYNGMPYNGSANAGLTEFRGTARQSRISLLAEGKIKSAKLTGYYEMDFLGAAPTANEAQTSSFNPRVRQLFGQAAFNNGWTVTAGQTWSLVTLNKKGIETRGEWVPATIDAQFVVGYNYARLMGARVTKKFNDKVSAAFAVENPEVLASSLNFPANTFGFSSSTTSTPGGGLAVATSADVAPDFIGKVAFDPGFGHYEIKGLGRVYRDRINTTTNKTVGGGLGFGAILPVVAKKVDFIAQGMYGRGTGRFGDSTNVDVTVRPNGTIVPLKTAHALAGFELHPSAATDIYVYGGDEYLGREAYVSGTTGYGYGSPLADNSGCSLVVPGAAKCQANIKNIYEGTFGFWHRFCKGPMGTMQFGGQYEYAGKNTWRGLNGVAPRGIENIIMTSFRYYLP